MPFRWKLPDRTLDMVFVGGVLGIERDGGWLRPRLGQAVVEILPRTGPLDHRLPERWLLTDIRRVTDCPEARILDTVVQVRHEGGVVEADLAIELEPGLLVLRTVDGQWHAGEPGPEPGQVRSWGPEADLVTLLRSI